MIRAGAGQEQEQSRSERRTWAGAVSPQAIFHRQEEGRSRAVAGAGQEQNKIRVGARQKQEQGRSPSIALHT